MTLFDLPIVIASPVVYFAVLVERGRLVLGAPLRELLGRPRFFVFSVCTPKTDAAGHLTITCEDLDPFPVADQRLRTLPDP